MQKNLDVFDFDLPPSSPIKTCLLKELFIFYFYTKSLDKFSFNRHHRSEYASKITSLLKGFFKIAHQCSSDIENAAFCEEVLRSYQLNQLVSARTGFSENCFASTRWQTFILDGFTVDCCYT